ncbi:hypothetical protein AD944_02960 [Acetobacter tropicalis]|nr:hypothetical protein AD944_02960 [Acetobacter tropicalis]
MKSLRFFCSIAAFLRCKNQSRSFSPLPLLLHLRCALMTGVTVSFFGVGVVRRTTLNSPEDFVPCSGEVGIFWEAGVSFLHNLNEKINV